MSFYVLVAQCIYAAVLHLFYNISVPSCFLGLGKKDEK